jgi:hypothetical protein
MRAKPPGRLSSEVSFAFAPGTPALEADVSVCDIAVQRPYKEEIRMSKPRLTLAEIEGLSAVELPERNLYAPVFAGGAGGLIGVAVAADVHVPIEIRENEVCVAVAAVGSVAGCDQ